MCRMPIGSDSPSDGDPLMIAIISSGEARGSVYGNDMEIVGSSPSIFLNELLKAGVRVIVVSSKPEPTQWDRCWMALLPAADIYWTDGRDRVDPWNSESPVYIKPWERAFAALGLTHPKSSKSWLNWQAAAMEQGVITHQGQLQLAR